ncbi:hypothetical protein [Xanthomonas theicola]|uniref:Transposase IS204/IS1001/IS1096/IS1165 DDE domain-containing protein n=1 Tax=Xanthomonas theicola TaxID=56464 RepID=A0A2S6ZI32_9XANT|nr:hypothetical protein [Xanthomonas theicola]PPT91933.1 hypothetical protein XthCFBP4691_06150 [Xanthomonas theicola]QNH25705.1 hypothetical protein G4Q83_14380 [Xanthomonas theicola]
MRGDVGAAYRWLAPGRLEDGKAIGTRHLQRTLGPVDLDGVRRLAMDEFAIQKGHRYAPWW